MAKLLDQYGNPVVTKTLSKPAGAPGITSVRKAWSASIAAGLTPNRLSKILTSAAAGNLHDFLILAEEMEERDPHYASVLGVRKRAVSGIEPIVTPASDDAKDVAIADAVRADLAQHDGFTDLVEDMMDALGKGFSQIELIWGRSAQKWWVDEFIYRDPKFFTFDRATGREIRLIDEQDPEQGVALDPYKWISHKAKLKSGLIARGGLARLVAFGWMCKSYAVKDWIAFIETYGLPLRLGRYGASATKEDVDTLFTAVANIGTDAAAVLPENMRIDFEQATASRGNDIFENLARWVDEQTSKAVLGQTMTSDNGSSNSQAQVHNDVRHDIAKADARSVSGTLNRDLIKPYVDLNYGTQERYPRISIVIEEAEDTDMVLRNTKDLIAQGLKVKQSEVRAKLGYSEPDADDEVLAGSNAPQPAKSDGTSEIAKNRSEATSPRDDIADLSAALSEDWERVMNDIITPVGELLETAVDYNDALALLAQTFPKMDSAELIDAFVQASVQARALGDQSDG